MKNIFILCFLLISLMACVSTRTVAEETQPLVDVSVKQWMNTHKVASAEKLAIIVKSNKALEGYKFLKLVKTNFYGGHATYVQLQILIKDPNVLRVYAGTQKLHK